MTAPDTATDQATTGKEAGQKHELSPDVLPWERQPWETETQYAAFVSYRDSQDRKVGDHGSKPYQWSSWNLWAHRVYQWDLHQARVDDEQLIRYRIKMNERHRTIAAGAVDKLRQWLENVDIDTLKPNEAARWLEVAVKVEREAAGLVAGQGGVPPPPPQDEGSSSTMTIADILSADPAKGATLARQIHELMTKAGQPQ